MLKSVEWCDQFVILDNGSTDKTLDIIREWGKGKDLTILQDKKKNDLAYLRNKTLALCKYEYVFSLDGDESFNLKDLPRLKRMMQSCDGVSLRSRYYTDATVVSHDWNLCKGEYKAEEKASGKTGYVDIIWGIRFFRRVVNGKTIWYEGKMHEMVDGTINEAHGHHRDINMPIHHYKELTPEDCPVMRFNVERRTKIKSFLNCASHHFRLGKGYLYIEHNYKKAHYHFDRALELLKEHQNYIHFFKAVSFREQGEIENSIVQLNRAIAYNKNYAGAWYLLGLNYDKMKFYDMADVCFKEANRLQPHHPIYKEILGKMKIKQPKVLEDLPVMGIGLS